jgi:hypothetical protein
MSGKRSITRDDIMDMTAYGQVRAERRKAISAIKQDRRLAVGPFVTFYFECYETMLYQVHEMLHAERGGAAQIADELAAYNPLIPQGREFVATMMIGIEDPVRRDQELRQLTFIEKTVTLTLDGMEIAAVAEEDVERTKADGKTSALHFLHFPLTDAQAEAFKAPGARAVLGIGHENYAHMAVVPENIRAALATDLD